MSGVEGMDTLWWVVRGWFGSLWARKGGGRPPSDGAGLGNTQSPRTPTETRPNPRKPSDHLHPLAPHHEDERIYKEEGVHLQRPPAQEQPAGPA